MLKLVSQITGPGLALYALVLFVLMVSGPVTAWGAEMVTLECAPVPEGEVQTCEKRSRPKDLEECVRAVNNMKASGSAKQLAVDMEDRVGWKIQIICQGTPYTFTVPGG